MKEWIPTSQIEPADLEGTVSGRYGATVMFVAFSSVSGWLWICGSHMEKIGEPPLLFLEPAWAASHPRKVTPLVSKTTRLRRKKSEQLLMEF